MWILCSNRRSLIKVKSLQINAYKGEYRLIGFFSEDNPNDHFTIIKEYKTLEGAISGLDHISNKISAIKM